MQLKSGKRKVEEKPEGNGMSIANKDAGPGSWVEIEIICYEGRNEASKS